MKRFFLTAGIVLFLLMPCPALSGIFITLGPHITWNSAGNNNSELNSAVSPVKFSLGCGLDFALPEKSGRFSFIPYIKLYGDYYLWAEDAGWTYGRALPAEMEHRTALAIHALIDLPFVYKISYRRSLFSAGIGIAVLARYGFLAQGVPDEDADDIDKINSDFWSNLHFLYPSVQIGWDYQLSNDWKMGLELRGYYPVSNLLESEPLSPIQNAMLSATVRITLPYAHR